MFWVVKIYDKLTSHRVSQFVVVLALQYLSQRLLGALAGTKTEREAEEKLRVESVWAT